MFGGQLDLPVSVFGPDQGSLLHICQVKLAILERSGRINVLRRD